MVRCFSVLLLRMSIIPAPEWIKIHKNKWSSSVCPQQCGGYVCSVSSHYSQWGGYHAHFILDKRRMQSAKKHILDTRSWKWGKGRFLSGLSDSQNNTLQHWDCNFSYFSEKSIGLFFGGELEREEMRWRNTEIKWIYHKSNTAWLLTIEAKYYAVCVCVCVYVWVFV